MKDQEKETLRNALQRIANWDIPKVWAKDLKRYVSYAVQFGSNGERDYIIDLAETALKVSSQLEEKKDESKIIESLKGVDSSSMILVEQEDGWVSVRDRLPDMKINRSGKYTTIEGSKEVLVFDGKNVFPDSYDLEQGFHKSITHWRLFESINPPHRREGKKTKLKK